MIKILFLSVAAILALVVILMIRSIYVGSHRRIGERFRMGKRVFVVKEFNSTSGIKCKMCDMKNFPFASGYDAKTRKCPNAPFCSSKDRRDKKDVYFELVSYK